MVVSVAVADTEPRSLERSGRMDTQTIVLEFYDSIARQRKAKTTFEIIARLLTQSGHKCNDKTLQKFFLREQSRRRGDEEAA